LSPCATSGAPGGAGDAACLSAAPSLPAYVRPTPESETRCVAAGAESEEVGLPEQATRLPAHKRRLPFVVCRVSISVAPPLLTPVRLPRHRLCDEPRPLYDGRLDDRKPFDATRDVAQAARMVQKSSVRIRCDASVVLLHCACTTLGT